MLILGIDTATMVCGTALIKDGVILAEYNQNNGKTHSQRLMPLIDAVLKMSGAMNEKIDAVATTVGPGSFTGLRIGVVTARAIAQAYQIPAVGVSTLEVLASAVMMENTLITPILDARRDQVYTAAYRWRFPENQAKDLRLETVSESCVISVDELVDRLNDYNEAVCFSGDGLFRHRDFLRESLGNRYREAVPPLVLNRASVVAWIAEQRLLEYGHDLNRDIFSYQKLYPVYLRKPEAERNIICRKSD